MAEKKEITIEDLENLKLHESLDINGSSYVVRVPGGLSYRDWDVEKDHPIPGGHFVPFNTGNKIDSSIVEFERIKEEIELVKIKIEGMKAANITSFYKYEDVKYGEDHFASAASEISELSEKLRLLC